jgi:hypothetical protein
MANEERVRTNFQNGYLDVALAAGDLTMTSAQLMNFPVINSKQHAAITLDPRQEGGDAEIVWVVLHAQGEITAIIRRGQEGTIPRDHDMNIRWAHAPTRNDFKNYATRTYARATWR